MWKKWVQISGFAALKKPQVLEKKIFEKKFVPAYFCRYDLQNGFLKIFLNKWVSRYLSFGDFKVPKDCSSP